MDEIVCPHCGESDGFYVEADAKVNIIYSYNSQGKHIQSDFSGLDARMDKVAYCDCCNKKIGETDDLVNWEENEK